MKNEKGITLIALIITIIVMLILVGVTVNVALNGGLFTKAKEAVNSTQIEVDKETLLSAVLGALDSNGEIDFAKLDVDVRSLGFEGSNGTYTKNDNTYKVDKYGNVELVEPEIEKIVTAQDEEFAYWKTDGNGTIIYYDVPEDKIPETLIIPCKIGDEEITKIGMYALCGIKIQRNEDGSIFIDEEGNPNFLDEVNSEGLPIAPTGQTTKIKNIIISKGIETTEPMAMAFCTSLRSLIIPSTITSIDEETFGFSGTELEIIMNGGSIELNNDPRINKLNIKSADTITIGREAFYESTLLEEVNLEGKNIFIGQSAFIGCTNLKKVNISDGLKILDVSAFSGCTSIKEIYIPASIQHMSGLVFKRWTSEQTIYMGAEKEPEELLPNTTLDTSVPGWFVNWREGCNANIVWGVKR